MLFCIFLIKINFKELFVFYVFLFVFVNYCCCFLVNNLCEIEVFFSVCVCVRVCMIFRVDFILYFYVKSFICFGKLENIM